MQWNNRTIIALASLLAGFAYYLVWRWLELPLTDVSAGSFPSFIFVFAFGLILPELQIKNTKPLRGHWLLLVLITEPFFGTASLRDGAAAVLGFLLARAVLSRTQRTAPNTRHKLVFLTLAPLLLAGSYIESWPSNYNTPIYMSYSELRQAVAVEEPRAMNELGRLVVYQDHLFINEMNLGLHVVDNTDPSSPLALAFINIPGNTDVSIRDGYLYADSFIDLVVIDIRDRTQVAEINRQVDVFPWDAYQVIGDDYWVDADQTLGVVIGVEEQEQ